MRVLDLFCGLGGWVQSFPKDWDITGYDIIDFSQEYPFKFIKCDLMEYNNFPGNVDLIVASPPCTEFSKSSLPKSWACNRNKEPDIENALKLFSRAKEIINQVKPEYWIIENVRGSVKFVGKEDYKIGSRYLWTNINLNLENRQFDDVYGKWKVSPGKNRSAIRSKIPFSISQLIKNYITVLIVDSKINRDGRK